MQLEEAEPQAGVNRHMGRQRAPAHMETARNQPIVKPAKLNIPEFEGQDVDSWIQTIEQYFDSARTPLEQRTEIAIT